MENLPVSDSATSSCLFTYKMKKGGKVVRKGKLCNKFNFRHSNVYSSIILAHRSEFY